MKRSDLIRLYPKLFHMAAPSAWPGILRHGLLSTQALLDLFEADSRTRAKLLSARRPEGVTISHPEHGEALVRDQKPLSEAKLASCLDGYTVAEWLQLLNGQVFFWLQPERLQRLLAARAYRSSEHLVITFDTERLLNNVPNGDVLLSRINSGSTVYRPVPRGVSTFLGIDAYPHPERSRARKAASDVAELCVKGGVYDVEKVADSAAIHGPTGIRQIWQPESEMKPHPSA